MAREKYLLRDDETGYYWKSTLKQSTIDAIVNPINGNTTQEIDELQTSLEAKLDAVNANISAQGTAIVNAITGLQTTLQTSLTELGTKLDALNTAVAGVDASVDEVTAAVNDVNTDTESIDAKMDTANTHLAKLDPIQGDVETIRDNTTPVPVSVELIGLEGMSDFTIQDNGMGGGFPYVTLFTGDLTHRGWRGNLVYSNGKRVPLSASDFSSDKFRVEDEKQQCLKFDSNGDVYVDPCGGDQMGGRVIYTYSDGITGSVEVNLIQIGASRATYSDFVAHNIDLAHIQVGQTVDFTANDLTCVISDQQMGDYEATVATSSAACPDAYLAYTVTWESSNPDVLAPVEDQPGKFSAIKAGTSTITYKIDRSDATATFNAVVEADTPTGD